MLLALEILQQPRADAWSLEQVVVCTPQTAFCWAFLTSLLGKKTLATVSGRTPESGSCPPVLFFPSTVRATCVLLLSWCPLAALANPVPSCSPSSLVASSCPCLGCFGLGHAVGRALSLSRSLSRPALLVRLLLGHAAFPVFGCLWIFSLHISLRVYARDPGNQERLFSSIFVDMQFSMQMLRPTLEFKELTPKRNAETVWGPCLRFSPKRKIADIAAWLSRDNYPAGKKGF